MAVLLANFLWFLSNLAKYFLFIFNINRVEARQSRILKNYVKNNRDTYFGKNYNFINIKSVQDFQNNVPIFSYENYLKYINKIKKGDTQVLTKERVLFLEPTSGSTAASKYIPYTDTLKKEFQNGLGAWIVDMFLHNPSLFFGKAYWLITPNIKNNPGDIVGFDDDSEYLGFFGRLLATKLLVMPNEVSKLNDQNSFFYVTLLFLLKNKNIAFISIWSPTILGLFIEYFENNFDQLLVDLARGKINKHILIDDDLRLILEKYLSPCPQRAQEIRSLIKNNQLDVDDKYSKIWPKLKLISCWADGNSKKYLDDIKKYFPQVKIQAKGLIATECFISFPWGKSGSNILSINSHFFEFESLDQDQKIYLAHQLKLGFRYQTIVTTGGGLYRYRLGDVIEVIAFDKQTPVLKFIGKADNVSDLFGEKINEQFISHSIEQLFLNHQIQVDFFLLAPEIIGNHGRYVLFMETNFKHDLGYLIKDLEKALCENFHYQHCRQLGQLDEVAIFIIKQDGLKSYYQRCVERGQKLGNIKIKNLDTATDWHDFFAGFYFQ